MTLRIYASMMEEIINILKLENGTEKESKGVTGNQGMRLASQIFPRGMGWPK